MNNEMKQLLKAGFTITLEAGAEGGYTAEIYHSAVGSVTLTFKHTRDLKPKLATVYCNWGNELRTRIHDLHGELEDCGRKDTADGIRQEIEALENMLREF